MKKIFFLLFISFFGKVLYAQDYIPLANYDGELGSVIKNSTSSFSNYLNTIVGIMIAIAALAAVVMIVLGGLQYMTTDAIAGKKDGRQKVTSALGGLILALGSWLILSTINPDIVRFDFKIDNVGSDKWSKDFEEWLKNINDIPTYIGEIKNPTYSKADSELKRDGNDLSITPSSVRIDTDGIERPPFHDPHWQPNTSLPGLNANKDFYVVVPIGSSIPLGTPVTITDHTSGKQIEAYVGDRGPTKNGYGEISLAAARAIGAWDSSLGNATHQHEVTYTFHVK